MLNIIPVVLVDRDIDIEKNLGDYPVAIQQMVAIARALELNSKILILDELTSSLNVQETERLFTQMRMLKIGGTSMAGGRYSLAGTVVGALIIQTLITALLTRAVPVQFTLIFQAAVVVVVLMLQSSRVKEMAFKRRARKEASTHA